ncbi:MAG: GIY-YIG nuclease family protein [Planctomycetota bacterium]
MPRRVLHVHEPRIGIGLPSRTVRPWRRRGDSLLEGFLAALAEPSARVLLTGRLFDRGNPPAHLVDRVVAPLRERVARGAEVLAPPETPRPLLFLAAGVRLQDAPVPGKAPEFWRVGAYRVLEGDDAAARSVDLPAVADVRLCVTGLGTAEALARLREALLAASRARFVRVSLVGETDEPELIGFGPRELSSLLPGGVEGAVVKDIVPRRAPPVVPEDDQQRRSALARVRESLPELPAKTGVYEFLDERGRVLYVGKAVDLRRRIASHFTAEAREPSPRGPMLLATRGVRVDESSCELTALLSEARRIREVRPPYNRQMKERESFRYLRIGLESSTPGVESAPEVVADGATWYGPFPKRWMVDRSVRVLQVIYGLKSCAWAPGDDAPAACTDRDLGICSSPCTGRVSHDDYRRRVRMARDRLLGEGEEVAPFGELNAPAAGLLGREDLRIFEGFVRSFRRLLENLRSATGWIPLPGGRILLVLGGLEAGRVDDREEAARRIEAFLREPARTWVGPDEVDEVRILSHWLRREAVGHSSTDLAPDGKDGGPEAVDEDPRDP